MASIIHVMKNEESKRKGLENDGFLKFWLWLTWSGTPCTNLEWPVNKQTLLVQEQGSKVCSAVYSGHRGGVFQYD